MAHRVLQALHGLSRELRVPVITPEYEILLTLLREGSMNAEQLCLGSSLSRAGFFMVVDRLKHWKFITCTTDPLDRRRKAYRLHPRTAEILIGNLKMFQSPQVGLEVLSLGVGDGADPTTPGQPTVDRNVRLPHLTCEYQILLYLYFRPGAATGEVEEAISASPTKFHAAMRSLLDLKLVERNCKGQDRRRKHYFLSDPTRHAIERANRRMLSWVDEMELHSQIRPSAAGISAQP